jgi:hypothetical protein
MKTITTTIKRPWLAAIVAGEKKVEYREIKSYWTKRFSILDFPFRLRLINGMTEDAPEVTVLIDRIRTNRRSGEYELRIAKVLTWKHWKKRRRTPR